MIQAFQNLEKKMLLSFDSNLILYALIKKIIFRFIFLQFNCLFVFVIMVFFLLSWLFFRRNPLALSSQSFNIPKRDWIVSPAIWFFLVLNLRVFLEKQDSFSLFLNPKLAMLRQRRQSLGARLLRLVQFAFILCSFGLVNFRNF